MIWAARKGAFGAVGRLRPNYLVNDGTVPRTKLPETLAKVIAVGEKYNRITSYNVCYTKLLRQQRDYWAIH